MSLSLHGGLEDMGALFLGPSFLMADPWGPLLDGDEEKPFSEGPVSPLSFSCYADSTSALPSLSPPSSPPSFLGQKPGDDLSVSWLSSEELLDSPLGTDGSQEDEFSGMDWMAEKIDLSEFDLDSLIGSCDSDESPSSPEDIIASLASQVDLDSLQFTAAGVPPQAEPDHVLPALASPTRHEPDVKLEPPSPVPSPLPPTPAFSPAFTLELGSEVDVSEGEKSVFSGGAGAQQIVLSLPTSNIVVILAPKEEAERILDAVPAHADDHSDGDSGVGSDAGSPQHSPYQSSSPTVVSSSRNKPYSRPSPDLEPPAMTGKVKSTSGPSKGVEKKLKKMEQNKTAATRYRQKKRAEQETLHTECRELENRNRELMEKADAISKEIQYLKDLIEEVRTAKTKRNQVHSSSS